jgi:hypothetical protein
MSGLRIEGVIFVVIAFFQASCTQPPVQSLALKNFVIEGRFDPEDPPDSIEGNVVSIPMAVEGVGIVKADGDTSGDTGHFHVFIDKEPVAIGERIPTGPGIVHSTENPITIYGLGVGRHSLTVALGDGTHTRFGDGLEARVVFDVDGPSVKGRAPANIKEGQPLTVKLAAEGVQIKQADARRSKTSGHFHVLIDPEQPPMEGDAIPTRSTKTVHTAENEVRISHLERGEHTLWIVLGDGQHYVFDPAVMDKLTVTVE